MKVFDADSTTPIAAYGYDGSNRRIVKMTYASGSLAETRHFYQSRKAKSLRSVWGT